MLHPGDVSGSANARSGRREKNNTAVTPPLPPQLTEKRTISARGVPGSLTQDARSVPPLNEASAYDPNFAGLHAPSFSFHLRPSPSAPRGAVAAPAPARTQRMGNARTFLSPRCHCFLLTLQSVYISA